MNRIASRKQLSENVFRLEVEAPSVARAHRAGQFVMVMADAEFGERIPLTIADADPARGLVTLVFQAVGATTIRLSRLAEGDSLASLAGPLGRPTSIRGVNGEAPGHVVCVGGGIGAAPLHPIAQALKRAGNRVTVVMGARTRDLLVMEDEMRALADELVVVTDDGSYGRRGLVTEPLAELCAAGGVDEAIAIGPPVMMKFCAAATRPHGVKTTVSLNTVMIDGTGMCGGCRVSVGGKIRFTCVDGPEFDGHQVDWDQLMQRLGAFRDQERAAKEHVCRLSGEVRP